MSKDIIAYIDKDGYYIKNEYNIYIDYVIKPNTISLDGEYRFVKSRKYIFGIVYIWRKI